MYPHFSTVVRNGVRDFDLDVLVAASGWDKADDDALHRFIESNRSEEGEENENEDGGLDEEQLAALRLEEDEAREESESDDDEEAPQLVEESVRPEASGSRSEDDSSGEDEESDEDDDDEEEVNSDPDADLMPPSEVHGRTARATGSSRRPKAAVRKAREPRNVEGLVNADLAKTERRQGNKHHGKRAASQRTLGRAKKGSKKKTDVRASIKAAQQF